MTTISIDQDLLRRLTEGDKDAITQARDLLPKPEPLFDRWATHEKYGRVLCMSHYPRQNGGVYVALSDDSYSDGTDMRSVPVSSLRFDPLTLTTEADFDNAPEGTVVDRPDKYPHEKQHVIWHTEDWGLTSREMAELGTWRVIRWGKGEQA